VEQLGVRTTQSGIRARSYQNILSSFFKYILHGEQRFGRICLPGQLHRPGAAALVLEEQHFAQRALGGDLVLGSHEAIVNMDHWDHEAMR